MTTGSPPSRGEGRRRRRPQPKHPFTDETRDNFPFEDLYSTPGRPGYGKGSEDGAGGAGGERGEGGEGGSPIGSPEVEMDIELRAHLNRSDFGLQLDHFGSEYDGSDTSHPSPGTDQDLHGGSGGGGGRGRDGDGGGGRKKATPGGEKKGAATKGGGGGGPEGFVSQRALLTYVLIYANANDEDDNVVVTKFCPVSYT